MLSTTTCRAARGRHHEVAEGYKCWLYLVQPVIQTFRAVDGHPRPVEYKGRSVPIVERYCVAVCRETGPDGLDLVESRQRGRGTRTYRSITESELFPGCQPGE